MQRTATPLTSVRFRSQPPNYRKIEKTHIKELEAESIYIIREAFAEAKNPVMLYSLGKDSSVMLHLARKAFFIDDLRYSIEIAQVVKLVDTRDLKSLEGNFVPVQVRPWAPISNVQTKSNT